MQFLHSYAGLACKVTSLLRRPVPAYCAKYDSNAIAEKQKEVPIEAATGYGTDD